MEYTEIFITFSNGSSSKKLEILNLLYAEKIDNISSEMILALATADSEAKIRQEAKKWIKKCGSESSKNALQILGKRNFNQKQDETLPDLLALKEIEHFNLVLFAKYLFLFCKNEQARDYFFNHANADDIRFFVHFNCFQYGDLERVAIYFGSNCFLSAQTLQQIWDSLDAVADKIRMIIIETKEDWIPTKTVQMPQLYELVLRIPTKKFPIAIFDLQAVVVLKLSLQTEEFPVGISSLKKLKRFSITSPIKNLAEDLFELKELEELYLWETKLTEIPEAIGNLDKLKGLNITDNQFIKKIPQAVFDLPLLNDVYKKDIRAKFLATTAYDVLMNEMEFYIRFFDSLEIVQTQLVHWKNNSKAALPELLIAVSKCHYDDEHGLKIRNFHSTLIKYGPEPFQKLCEKVKNPAFLDEETSEKVLADLEKKLKTFEWFDSALCIQMIKEMIQLTNTVYPYKKW